MKKVNIITLGCSKNVVDSEHIAAQFAGAGYAIEYDSDSGDASIVVINTCGFIGDAKEESIETILRFAAARSDGRIEKLYVIGCLSERYADELRKELPEVDSFFGARDIYDVVRALMTETRMELECDRVLSTPPHYAYLKISEGCNWGCGYCAIPLIRGKHVSVPMERIEDEARRLAAKGVRELIVIAQDTTYYGLDIYGRRCLADLLGRLCKVEGIEWIRLHYAYPTGFPDDVIDTMAAEPKICKYLDIPFQHIADSQLRSMRRGLTKADTYKLIEKLRIRIPDIAIRTTLLVGYPGETEQDFEELLEFVHDTRFERLGVFPYCEEEGTYSALKLVDDVPDSVKRQRVERLMELQREISLEINREKIGVRNKVIIDRVESPFYIGRSQWDSPEVDQEILIKSSSPLRIGDFYEVLITSVDDYDLYAEICGG